MESPESRLICRSVCQMHWERIRHSGLAYRWTMIFGTPARKKDPRLALSTELPKYEDLGTCAAPKGPRNLAECCRVLPAWPFLPWTLFVYGQVNFRLADAPKPYP